MTDINHVRVRRSRRGQHIRRAAGAGEAALFLTILAACGGGDAAIPQTQYLQAQYPQPQSTNDWASQANEACTTATQIGSLPQGGNIEYQMARDAALDGYRSGTAAQLLVRISTPPPDEQAASTLVTGLQQYSQVAMQAAQKYDQGAQPLREESARNQLSSQLKTVANALDVPACSEVAPPSPLPI